MTKLNNCHNRPEFPDTVRVQDGWVEINISNLTNVNSLSKSLVPNMITIPFAMSKMKDGCHQWGSDGAIHKGLLLVEGCEECKWKPN